MHWGDSKIHGGGGTMGFPPCEKILHPPMIGNYFSKYFLQRSSLLYLLSLQYEEGIEFYGGLRLLEFASFIKFFCTDSIWRICSWEWRSD